jgi:YD repeat-containing protein
MSLCPGGWFGGKAVLGLPGEVGQLASNGVKCSTAIRHSVWPALTHTPAGLLTEIRDAEDEPHSFSYTADGLLRSDSNSSGASKSLTLAQTSGELFSIAVRTMMGRTTSYLTERLADGDRKRTTTNAAGLQTIATRAVMRTADGQWSTKLVEQSSARLSAR